MRKYRGIELGRLIFACLIPFLHIPFQQELGIIIVQQYIARLGVPFFLAVSGMFLSQSIEKTDRYTSWRRYAGKIGKLLAVWLAIYSPFIVRFDLECIQRLIFITPAYLWYLTALLVASIPFCFIRNRKVLYIAIASLVLYIVGTLFGDSYGWFTGGALQYKRIFITTRNGIFFGLPLMCIGELTWKKKVRQVCCW